MLKLLLIVILVVGFSTIVWSSIGLVRMLSARSRRRRYGRPTTRYTTDDVAVLIAAHNEELVIAETLRAASRHLPISQIFVASDGSTDATSKIARNLGANVLDVQPNRGKAGALVAAISHFRLDEQFEFVMLLDADTHLSEDYFATALPQFTSDDVVAVAGTATTLARPIPKSWMGRLLISYRERVYVAVQYLQKYGQAAAHVNVVAIVPGFASIYRSRILSQINIDAAGLTIEDFNMTFEVHTKELGRIAFNPRAAIAYTQDPDNFSDYFSQLRRWSLGFWQTALRHRPTFNLFWTAVGLFSLELVTSSLLVLLLIPALILSVIGTVLVAAGTAEPGSFLAVYTGIFPPLLLLAGVFIPDYLVTLFATVVTRRPSYLIVGLLYPFLRMVDASACLRSFTRAVVTRRKGTNGVWKSPERRSSATGIAATAAAGAALTLEEDERLAS